jgi:hypothetical protein
LQFFLKIPDPVKPAAVLPEIIEGAVLKSRIAEKFDRFDLGKTDSPHTSLQYIAVGRNAPLKAPFYFPANFRTVW